MAVTPRIADPNRPRRHRRRLRSMAFAPTLMTLGNLICGFAAIHFSIRAMYDFGAGVMDQPLTVMNRALLDQKFVEHLQPTQDRRLGPGPANPWRGRRGVRLMAGQLLHIHSVSPSVWTEVAQRGPL